MRKIGHQRHLDTPRSNSTRLPESPSLKETLGEAQDQSHSADNFQNPLRSSPPGEDNYGSLPLANDPSDASMRDAREMMKTTYPADINVLSENGERGRGHRPFPSNDQMLTVNVNSQLDHIQSQPRQRQSLPGPGQKAQQDADEQLTISRQLSKTRPDLYY